MLNSESEDETQDRDRSRSPHSRGREETSSDDESLSPNSMKIMKIVKTVVARELAPVKRNLSKNLDTTTQMKGVMDQVKRGLAEVKMSTGNIEGDLRKARKSDPKSSLSTYVIGNIYKSVFRAMKCGKKKDELITAVVDELLEKNVIGPTDEDAVKAVAAKEFSHVKSHLRSLISQDLAVGNYVKFPKASHYLKTHIGEDGPTDDTREFLTIMALGLARYENAKAVPLSDSDKSNKKRIEQHTDYFWQWVNMKFDIYESRGETFGEKMKHILVNIGYQARKSEGAVRRATSQ